jgi:hypothetical protein
MALCEARALRAAKKGTVHVHGLFLVGLGKDPKEVEERGEPSIHGAGSSCPVIECCRLNYPTFCDIAEVVINTEHRKPVSARNFVPKCDLMR